MSRSAAVLPAIEPRAVRAGSVAPTDRGPRPEWVFGGLVAVFGLIFAFTMPPCQVADEPMHLLHAYHISEGHLLPERIGNWGGGFMPRGIEQLATAFNYVPFHPERQVMRQSYEAVLATPLALDDRVPMRYITGYYSFVPYLPPAGGIALARWMGGGPLALFYAGRLANLALAVLLVYGAIRITPIFKLVFGTVALLPISVHEFASLSVDAPTIGLALLLVAILFRLAIPNPLPARRGLITALIGAASALTLCKFPYAVLSLVYLGVPAERLGGRRRYLWVGAGLFAVTFSLAGAQTQLKKYTPGYIQVASVGASIEKQTHQIRNHPLRYVETVSATVAEHGRNWIDHLATLGWLDTPVNPLAMQLFFLFMCIVGLGDRTAGIMPSLRLKIAGLLAVALCGVVIVTCCYVAGSPVKARIIDGPQGRYFVPLLPLLMLPLYNRLVQVQTQPGVLLALTAAACTGVLIVAVASIVRRYYLPAEVQLWMSPLALALALLLFGAVAVRLRRRYAVC